MSFRDYLLLMGAGTATSWIAWLVVLFAIDPVRAGGFGFLLFYLTLALALVGTLAILGTTLRVLRHRQTIISRHVARSFRQAIFFTVILIGSLLLLSSGLFRWWTVGLLIFAIALIELAFLTDRRAVHH